MNINIYSLALLSTVALGLASCGNELDSDSASGEAVVFKAQLRNLDNGSKVTVAANGTNYTYAIAEDGTMTPEGAAISWGGNDFDIKAWTPNTSGSIALTDQTSAEKMAACDLLAAESKVTSRYAYLIFDHKMTRMNWILEQVDDSYTAEQVAAAKVSFLGYGATGFAAGTVTPEGNPDREIAALESVEDNLRQGVAIMAPADMWGKPLIKVTVGGDEYIYSPNRANSEDVASAAGDLVAGNSQKYYISITRKTLTVHVETAAVEWGATQDFGTGDITDAKLKAEVAADVASKPGYTVTGLADGYILNRETGFSISYTESAEGGLTWTGNCKVTRTETAAGGSNSTQTYTFSDIKSDITVSYLTGVDEGDYVYDNGCWGKEEVREGCKTIGRVFHVGRSASDDSSYSLCKVRGYVVPLRFGDNNEMQWFANQADATYINALANIPVSADVTVRESYYGGYKLTGLLNTALEPFSADWAEQVPFWYAFKNINMQAPALSSGWYIPTYAQLKDVCASKMYDNFTGTYWSSQVYPGTGNAAVGGVEEGEKTTLWAIRCGADQAVGYGWAIDRSKLLPILTF